MSYKIKMMWDNDVSVWIATSDEIKGLVLEHNPFDALIEKIKAAVPELLKLNKQVPATELQFTSSRSERVYA